MVFLGLNGSKMTDYIDCHDVVEFHVFCGKLIK